MPYRYRYLRAGVFGIRGAANAGLAQMVEHLICNQGAAGSIPAAGTIPATAIN